MAKRLFDPQPVSDGKQVLVLVPDAPGGIRSLFEQIQANDMPQPGPRRIYFSSHDDRAVVMGRFPARLLRFAKRLRSGDIALCHINLASRGSTLRKLIFAWLCRVHSVPYVIHLHGGGYREFFASLPPAGRSLVRALFGRAAAIIVLGQVWRDFVVEKIGADARSVFVLPNAVSGPETVPTRRETPVRLLFLGRLTARKGIPELLDALAALKPLSWHATVAGDGDVETFRRRTAELGLAGRIDFPGWVDQSAAARLLADSHILALPSHTENLPLSLLEGMAYGLLPVATPVGAVPDVIRDGENGVLVPISDTKALTSALAIAISNPSRRQAMARQARRDFEAGYDIRNYCARLDEIYRTALHR